MDDIKNLFNLAYLLMNIEIRACGYTFTLFQALMYGLIGFILLYIFFRLTR